MVDCTLKTGCKLQHVQTALRTGKVVDWQIGVYSEVNSRLSDDAAQLAGLYSRAGG